MIKKNTEDTSKLDMVQNRLTILQEEVLIATKNLDAIQAEIAQRAEDKKFYDDLIETLKPQVDSLQTRKTNLELEIAQGESALRAHEAQHEVMNSHYAEKQQTHDEREQTIVSRETEHGIALETFAREKEMVSQEKETLAKVRAAFMDAAQLMG